MASLRTVRTRRERARRQEGGVILIVLLIVMMMSGLAAFAAKNSSYEARSVGGTRQLQRMRRSGESFLVAVGSLLGASVAEREGRVSAADTRWTANAGTEVGDFRKQYNLPMYVEDDSLMQVLNTDSYTDLGGSSYPLGRATVAKESDINTGVVYPFKLESVALLERHRLPEQAGSGIGMVNGMQIGQSSYRVCVTAYSRLRVDGDTQRSGDFRQLHDSLSISRAYFELR